MRDNRTVFSEWYHKSDSRGKITDKSATLAVVEEETEATLITPDKDGADVLASVVAVEAETGTRTAGEETDVANDASGANVRTSVDKGATDPTNTAEISGST